MDIGHLKMVLAKDKGIELNAMDDKGMTSLHHACICGQIAVIKFTKGDIFEVILKHCANEMLNYYL